MFINPYKLTLLVCHKRQDTYKNALQFTDADAKNRGKLHSLLHFNTQVYTKRARLTPTRGNARGRTQTRSLQLPFAERFPAQFIPNQRLLLKSV
jgi:hypothetical protein